LVKKQKGSKNINKIIKIDPTNPRPELIKKAARVIKMGGVISFPTQYLYGLGADALNAKAVDRVFDIKQRPYNKPVSVLIKNRTVLADLVAHIPPAASRIMDNFWPGWITIVFEAKDTLPINLTAGTGKIGVRLPGHPVALALVNSVDGPVTATSANIAGNAGCSRISEFDFHVVEKLDLILDAGPLKGGIGSTVIDVTANVPEILREGSVSSKHILTVLNSR